MKLKYLFIIMVLVTIFSNTVFSEDVNVDVNQNVIIDTTQEAKINVYFFGTSTCPYCAQEKEFFTEYVKNNPDVRVYYFELDTQRNNSKLLLEFSKAFQERSTSVPITFISEKVWIGFSESIQGQMETIINNCRENTCKDSYSYLENQEEFKEYLTNDKYVKYLGEEIKKEKTEKIGFFKRIANFFKNIF